MSKNPFLNAIAALAYIAIVASMMFYGPKFVGEVDESVLVPIAMLSLFVLSAAVMGSLFFLQPVQLYLDNKKQEAVDVLLKTIGIFACITACIFIALLLFSRVF